jgi:glycosyltransferase involved in cell wall biosynthesis
VTGLVFIVSGDLWGGAEAMAVSLAASLRELGTIMRAVTFSEGLTAERLRAAGIETCVVDERRSFPAMVACARRCLKGSPVRLIHSHGYKENVLAAAVAPWLGWPRLVSTMHGLPEPASSGSPLKRRLVRGLNFGLLSRRFSATVAVSKDVRRELVEAIGLPAARVEVISNGIPLPSLNGQPAGLVIGSAGRLYPVKNFGLLIEVAARVCAVNPSVRFKVLGEGPERPLLEAMIGQRGLAGSVELPGFSPDASALYRECAVYINTSRHEGMPLAVLEAMAYGLPVVAPRVGGLPEMVADGREGLLAPAADADQLAERCLRLLDEPDLRRRLGEAARARVEREFSLAAMARRYLGLYERLAAGR